MSSETDLLIATISFRCLALELVTMIANAIQTNEETGGPKHILSTDDLCNLRLVDTHTCHYVRDAFAIRVFRHRKHMFSEYSLKALVEIARHSVFSTYVHKISLGPDRIPKTLPQSIPLTRTPAEAPYMSAWTSLQSSYAQPIYMNSKHETHFTKWHESRRVIQEEFHDSGRGTLLLKKALTNFTKLQVISIESYPEVDTGRGYNDSWCGRTHPWGANTLVQELHPIMAPYCVDARELSRELFRDAEPEKVNWHLDPILEALDAIKDRPNWKIDFYLNSSERYVQATKPFDIDSASWQACKDRVRYLNLHRTIQTLKDPHDRADWLTELFKSCGRYVEELHCQNTFYWSKIVCNAHLPTLRRLDIYHAPVQDLYLEMFLARHAECLESIKFNRVTLSVDEYSRRQEEDYPLGQYPSIVLQSDKYEREEASWIAKFELMLKLARLRSIHLEQLTWSQSIHQTSLLFLSNKDTRMVGLSHYARWKISATAEDDDIKSILDRAIRDNKVYFAGYDEHRHSPIWIVVFLEENEARRHVGIPESHDESLARRNVYSINENLFAGWKGSAVLVAYQDKNKQASGKRGKQVGGHRFVGSRTELRVNRLSKRTNKL
ncbi:hypothetical protein P171DRAFT_484454 [Karstenula rhodostoma CBS 690.94]|uniref:F-box domain-containing protein n=1 Tax=Karstenula rhodostoma CBS 690.94 TaxID=1392251 RepID=A0A9P4UE32_9PLEO|nr:hypothetical protein P171DRAFT_484454 [Karstenula rhodostoma CBS 690.94]